MTGESIEEKLVALRACEHLLPTVIIVISLSDNSVVFMSEKGLQILGTTMEELMEMGAAYHDRFFNTEDAKEYVPKILDLVARNNTDESLSIFQQVLQADCNCFKWYSTTVKVFSRNEEGVPTTVISCANPIEEQHYLGVRAKRILSESEFAREKHILFNELSEREKEVLSLLAAGYSSPEIAEKLHISQMTAQTHRRNIKRKLQANSDYELTRFASAFDLLQEPQLSTNGKFT